MLLILNPPLHMAVQTSQKSKITRKLTRTGYKEEWCICMSFWICRCCCWIQAIIGKERWLPKLPNSWELIHNINDQEGQLDGSCFNKVQAHLTWISCLHINLNSIQFPLESILGTCIHHLHPHLRGIWWPAPLSYSFKLS